jgi:hypothetical protein
MGILDKLRGSSKEKESTPLVVEVPPCPHTTLRPHWDNPADMGYEDRAETFTCEGCHQTFSQEEVRALRSTETERLQQQHMAAVESGTATQETPSN